MTFTQTLIQSRIARSTGTRVEVTRTTVPAGSFYETICHAHDTVCEHETRALAVALASAPEQWCEDCDEQLRRADAPATR